MRIESLDRIGTLIYIDPDALHRLQTRHLPETSEVSFSQSGSHKKQFQIGIKNILGISDSAEESEVTNIRHKLKHRDDDLILPAIFQLYEHGNLLSSLKDIPFPEDDRIGRSFFIFLNARFVYVETINWDRMMDGWFLKFRCVEYGDKYDITMGASAEHTTMSYYHIQEIFGDSAPTYLTVFGSATCKDILATKFYIKPFAIFLSGLSGGTGEFLKLAYERRKKLSYCMALVKDLVSSGMSPKKFCKERGISINELKEATSVLENSGLLDSVLESVKRKDRQLR